MAASDRPDAHEKPVLPALERYRGAIYALALERLRNPDDAHDVAQEALLRAHKQWPDGCDPPLLLAWLRTTAVNLCRDRWRLCREDPVEALEETPARDDTAAAAMRRVLLGDLWRGLRDLPEPNRVALLMSVLGGYTTPEIAQFLGVPETTVVGRIHRARARLRRTLLVWLDGALRPEGEGDHVSAPGGQ
jgi:RNA polymerase sigma-70 factor, ECF subfamily